MAQRLFLVKNSSPMSMWYKVYASGDEDPDIYEGFLLEQFKKYSKTIPKIIYTLDCDDSTHSIGRFYELIVDLMGGDNPARAARIRVELANNNNWFGAAVETIRLNMREAVKK